MTELPITAEDLTLYAMNLLDSSAGARVELLLRSSTEAREELALIRGDLATFALAAPQHTPPALSRQRLLKQVAREGRPVPIPVAMQDASPFVIDTAVPELALNPMRAAKTLTKEQRSKVKLPRIVAAPEPLFAVNDDDEDHAGAAAAVAGTAPPAPARAQFLGDATTSAQVPVPSLGRTQRNVPPQSASLSAIPDELPADTYNGSSAANTSGSSPGDRQKPVANIFAGYAATGTDGRQRTRSASLVAWTGWLAAAACAVAGVYLFSASTSLRQQLDAKSAALTRSNADVQRADILLQTLESPAAQRFVLARQDTAPVPAARVAYLPEHGSLVFQGTNLEPLAPYKTYELWLIPAGEGRQPIPAGTFKPDTRGYATLVLPSLPKGTVAGNFGVTVEDDGGSTAPTLPILLIGQQG